MRGREKVTPFVSCLVAVCDLSCFELLLRCLKLLMLLDFSEFWQLDFMRLRAKHLCESLCGRPRWLFEATA